MNMRWRHDYSKKKDIAGLYRWTAEIPEQADNVMAKFWDHLIFRTAFKKEIGGPKKDRSLFKGG